MLLQSLVATAVAGAPVYVDVEWRAMGLANHASHGPGFGLLVGLLDDHLRVGISGFGRPGPINPATFTLTPSQAYNGQSELSLRSDGSIVGLTVAPGLPLGDRVRLDAPITVGYGAFGFYLVGEDRNTPDGRLPSAWEDQMMDGRDASFGLGLDTGLRATLGKGPIRPYVAGRYSTVFGYDAFLADDYSGVSFALGITAGGSR